jgi:hypothetical protein
MADEASHCPTCTCGRRARVQADRQRGKGPGTIAWSEHVEAWNAYAAQYGRGQSAQRIHDRGGFGFAELESLLGHAPTTWRSGED